MAGPFRYVTPVEPQRATGRIAQVYAQIAEDFGMARMAVLMTLSPSPEVTAATWAMLRESLLAGAAPRTGKEVVALGVSMANRCPFCVDAHTMLLHATGDHRLAEAIARGDTPADPAHAALLAWAGATGGPVRPGPFPAELAHEYVGTALSFHFINRVASTLLTDGVLPANLQRSRLVRSMGGRVLTRTVRRRLPVGTSLAMVADLPARPEREWAAGTPVGAAFATLEAVAGSGGELLGDGARTAVTDAVEVWDGTPPPMNTAWLDGPVAALPAADRPGARLALLTALAPYRVTDTDVATWRASRTGGRTDEDLVRLCAFGAITATRRVEALITPTEHVTAEDRS
ncbi:carboxymuconolactone decarboxylase family protein [Nonomuraea zeae]|uniref:DNA-binding protein n=1 Tax=Nonomuraea zeae TaxID=1642303 RepID=A0A5S4F7S0_9ACTN|nr:carboxymuconolactone decarboxylase family protein [Nonomuraea zeae]TMR12431.1 DNA-binding protein [Nonomuraea zeae]